MEILDLNWLQWAGVLSAALIVGLTKAGFGVGSLALVLMTISLGAADMLPVLLIVLICGDVFAIVHYPKKQHWRNLGMLVPGCAGGVLGGWGVLHLLGRVYGTPQAGNVSEGIEVVLNPLVGTVAMAFVLIQLWRELRESRLAESPEPYRPRVWHGVGLGVLAGLTSTMAHAGGPLIALFLLPQRLHKDLFVGTTVAYFMVGNLMKLLPYALEGMFTAPRLGTCLVLVPAVVVGSFVGLALHKRVSDRVFRYVVYALTLLLALKLLLS